MTWTFTAFGLDFIPFLLINLFVCFFLIMSYDGLRWFASKILGISVRYVFWPAGALITLLSSFLENPFDLSGVLIEESENVAKWKKTAVNLFASFFAISLAVLFFIINFVFPWEIFQMIFSASSKIAMFSILPIGSLGGNEIKKYNLFLWLAAFLLIGAVYTIITFVMV